MAAWHLMICEVSLEMAFAACMKTAAPPPSASCAVVQDVNPLVLPDRAELRARKMLVELGWPKKMQVGPYTHVDTSSIKD